MRTHSLNDWAIRYEFESRVKDRAQEIRHELFRRNGLELIQAAVGVGRHGFELASERDTETTSQRIFELEQHWPESVSPMDY